MQNQVRKTITIKIADLFHKVDQVEKKKKVSISCI